MASLETGLHYVRLVGVVALIGATACGEVKEDTIDSGTPPTIDASSGSIDAALPPGCTNGDKDDNESDVDCGGDCPPCANGRDCGEANDCQSGVCTGGQCEPCTTHGDCNEISGRFCDDGGICRDKRDDGAGCGDPAQCTSNYCVDDVCCNEVCNDTCAACSTELTGLTNGECWGVPLGTVLSGECPGEAYCSGDRACYCPCLAQNCGDHGFECGTFNCIDTAETCASDTSGCGSADAPWLGWEDVITPDASDLTVTLLGIDELTGECNSNNTGSTTFSELRVGDGAILPGPPEFEFRQRSGLSFDLTSLPEGAKIVSATLSIYQDSVEGLAYTSPMNKVVLEHVRFDTVPFGLCAADPITTAFPMRDVSTSGVIGWRSVDITEAVRYELATCHTSVHMRMTFWPENGQYDDGINRAHFVSDNASVNYPYLTVIYR